MRSMTRRRRYLFVAVAVTALVATVTACGSSSSRAGGAATSPSVNLTPFKEAVQSYYKGQMTAPPANAPRYDKPVNAWIISCGQASEGCAVPTAAMKAAAMALGLEDNGYRRQFRSSGRLQRCLPASCRGGG